MAHFFLGLFNPYLIPIAGLLLIMGYIPGVEFFSRKLKFIIFAVLFLSTCLIPLIFIVIGRWHQEWGRDSNRFFDKVMPYLFAAMCSFLGSQFLGRLPIPGIFRVFLLGISFIMIVSTLISIKWKISENSLAMGGVLGTLVALNFKFGMNLIWLIVAVIMISGIVGSLLIYLEKDSPGQVYFSFLDGMICMFFIIICI